MKVKCKYCGKEKTTSPSIVKDINDYHCRDKECLSKFMFEKKGFSNIPRVYTYRKIMEKVEHEKEKTSGF